MKNFLAKVWDFLIRFRTWVLNVSTSLVVVLPLIVTTPEFAAVVSPEVLKFVLLANVALNLWMRPRPAVRAADPEAEITRRRKAGDEPPTGIGA